MDLDITIHKGDPEKPAVIFIHGLGVNKYFWTDPVNTKILAKNIPMKVFAAKKPRVCSSQTKKTLTVGIIPEKVENLWTAVINSGFSTVCWSQKRPAGPIRIAIEELELVVSKTVNLFPGRPLILIGHSRGGLVARKFMEKSAPGIKALITIATPHKGSSLSRLGKYLSPLSSILKKLLPLSTHGTVSEVLTNVNDLLEGAALKELLPGSDFLNHLKQTPVNGVDYLSFGGTMTKLITLYTWKRREDRKIPIPLLTVPDSLLKHLPNTIIPNEIISGKGDFMVTAESSKLPWASPHYNLPSNHISIVRHQKVINKTIELLDNM